jgi:hypothetical protein
MRTHVMLGKLIFVVVMAISWFIVDPAAAGQPEGVSKLKVMSRLDFGNYIRLEYPIWVGIEDLGVWIKESDGDTSKFVVCFDGVPFKVSNTPAIRDDRYLGFRIKPSKDTQDEWKNLVSPPFKRDGSQIDVTVRLDGATLNGSAKAKLVVFPNPEIYVFLVAMIVTMILFVYLARKSDIIRDAGPQPENLDSCGGPRRKPYSLARTQMACWFFVVIACYVFIWIITNDIKTLSATALMLIGISSATALGSAAVDSGKRANQDNLKGFVDQQLKQREVELVRLQSRITAENELTKATSDSGCCGEKTQEVISLQGDSDAKQREIQQLEQQKNDLQEKINPRSSQGFIADILSDDYGISFHRFQMVGITLVLIIIFVVSVVRSLTMMDFDSELLALMGISSGTFIGLKLPTQQG